MIGVNDDGQAAQLGEFERGVIVGCESIVRVEPRFDNFGSTRVHFERRFALLSWRKLDRPDALRSISKIQADVDRPGTLAVVANTHDDIPRATAGVGTPRADAAQAGVLYIVVNRKNAEGGHIG